MQKEMIMNVIQNYLWNSIPEFDQSRGEFDYYIHIDEDGSLRRDFYEATKQIIVSFKPDNDCTDYDWEGTEEFKEVIEEATEKYMEMFPDEVPIALYR